MNETFFPKVYKLSKKIPPGKVATYSQIAKLAGNPRAARAVGIAMKRNPDIKNIPCHRIIASDGSLCGYSAGKGVAAKQKLLNKEGVAFVNGKVDLTVYQWHPKEGR